MHDMPEGYCLPLHTSLTRPILLGGVPRGFAILNGTVCGAIGLGLQQAYLALPLWIVLQACAAWAAARDPWFLDIWRRHIGLPGFFSA